MKYHIKDNKVAILITPGFGIGWSTVGYDLYDYDIIKLKLQSDKDEEINKLIKERTKTIFYDENEADAYLYDFELNSDDLYVKWIPLNKEFRIIEYDGSESIEYNSLKYWNKITKKDINN